MTTSADKFFMKKVLDTCNFSLGDRWELELKKKKSWKKKKKNSTSNCDDLSQSKEGWWYNKTTIIFE